MTAGAAASRTVRRPVVSWPMPLMTATNPTTKKRALPGPPRAHRSGGAFDAEAAVGEAAPDLGQAPCRRCSAVVVALVVDAQGHQDPLGGVGGGGRQQRVAVRVLVHAYVAGDVHPPVAE